MGYPEIGGPKLIVVVADPHCPISELFIRPLLFSIYQQGKGFPS